MEQAVSAKPSHEDAPPADPAERKKRWRPRSERIVLSLSRSTIRWGITALLLFQGVLLLVGFLLGRTTASPTPAPLVAAPDPEPAIPEPAIPEPATAPPAPAKPPAPPVEKPIVRPLDVVVGAFSADGWGVQLGAYPSLEDAQRFLAAHAESLAGMKIHVIPTPIPGRGLWHRVRVGQYGTKSEAEGARRRLPPAVREGAIVVSYR